MINSTESNLFVLVPTIKVLGQECSENPQDERPIHEHSIPEVHRATFTLQELDYVKTISSQASSIVSWWKNSYTMKSSSHSGLLS